MKLNRQILFTVITGILININAEKCVRNTSPSLQLYRKLLCDYEASERPTRNIKNATKLNVIMIPKLIKFDDYSNTLEVHSWLYVAWKDDYLQWNASNFGDIDELWIQSNRMWTPDLAVQNAANADSVQMDISLTNCALRYKGDVVCVPSVVFSTRCNPDYRYWPFDQQNCSIELSSWSYNNNEIAFKNNELTVTTIHYKEDGEWSVKSINYGYMNKKSNYMSYEEFPTIIAYFKLQRAKSQLWRVFGTPTMILSAMTLTTLWLNPTSNERVLIGCVNFFCHFLCIGNLHWIMPQSESVPNILKFYYSSIILALVALILTGSFRKIMDMQDSPPPWISSLLSIILSSKIGQILLLSILDPKASACVEENADDNNDLVNTQTSKKSTWVYFTIVLSWISFISFLVIYIIMFALFLHMPITMK